MSDCDSVTNMVHLLIYPTSVVSSLEI